MKYNNADKLKELKARLIELKKVEGNKPFDNDYVEKIVDLAEECYNTDTNKEPKSTLYDENKKRKE